MEKDELYMWRCVELARHGLGRVAPNPMVGSVIVHNDHVIGEGYHKQFGQHHAEINAINSVEDKSLLCESTLYVNLEPCCHYGKTPPCTDQIINHNIRRVVIGCVDVYDAVAGKGIAKLRNQGIHVDVGILKSASLELNKRFFTFHQKNRPYIILKWAQTVDSFIDIERLPDNHAKPTWITSEKLRMLVHKWRTEEQAIMVGTNTALMDNPYLNVRDWTGRHPVRVVIDEKLTLSSALNLFDNSQITFVFNSLKDKRHENTHWIRTDFKSARLLQNILEVLKQQGIQSVIVEGGQKLLQAFIESNLWDEARIFQGNKFFVAGVKAPAIPAKKFVQTLIEHETLYWVKNPSNPY